MRPEAYAMAKEYEVGYGKPPRHTRFKPGRSGNPKGRPKGHRNFKTDLVETLKTGVKLTEKGKRKTVSTQRAALLRLREKALGGDARALDRLISLAQAYNNEEMEEVFRLSSDDAALLEIYNKRLLSGVGGTAEAADATETAPGNAEARSADETAAPDRTDSEGAPKPRKRKILRRRLRNDGGSRDPCSD